MRKGFNSWFKAQFGERPDKRSASTLEHQAINARYAANALTTLSDQVQIWEDRRNAAYKAYLVGKDGIK